MTRITRWTVGAWCFALAGLMLFVGAFLQRSGAVSAFLPVDFHARELAQVAFGCFAVASICYVFKTVQPRGEPKRLLPSIGSVLLALLMVLLCVVWNVDFLTGLLADQPIAVHIGSTTLAAAAMMALLRPSRVLLLLMTAGVFFGAKAGYVFALDVYGEKHRQDVVFKALESDHVFIRRSASNGGKLSWVGVDFLALQSAFNQAVHQRLAGDELFAYAFWKPFPTAERLALEALQQISVSKRGDRFSSASPGEVRANVIKEFEGDPELFLAFVGAARSHVDPLALHFTIINVLMGNAFGIHLLVYVLFAYCVLEIHGGRRLRREAGSGLGAEMRLHRLMMRSGCYETIHNAREAVPQLGFIGTVLGLSQAMASLAVTDDVQSILKRPGVSPELAASLGLSFNTTPVALLGLLVLGVYYSWLASEGEYYPRAVHAVRTGNTTEAEAS